MSVLGAGDMELLVGASGLWTCCRRSCFLGFLVLRSSLCFAQLFCTAAACLFRPAQRVLEIVSATTSYLGPDVFLDCLGGSQQPLWGLQPRKRLFVGDAWLFAKHMISGTEKKNATEESGPSH